MFDPIFMLAFLVAEILVLLGPIYWLAKRYLPNAPALLTAFIVSISGIFGFHFIGSLLLYSLPYWDWPPLVRVGTMVVPAVAAAGLAWVLIRLFCKARSPASST